VVHTVISIVAIAAGLASPEDPKGVELLPEALSAV